LYFSSQIGSHLFTNQKWSLKWVILNDILTDFDVVEKALNRRFSMTPKYQNPVRIDPFYTSFLISSQVQIRVEKYSPADFLKPISV